MDITPAPFKMSVKPGMIDSPFVALLVTLPNTQFVFAWDTTLYDAMPEEFFSDLRTRIDIELAMAGIEE